MCCVGVCIRKVCVDVVEESLLIGVYVVVVVYV